MTPDEVEIRRKLRDDFQHYASRCLNIRTKAGKVERLDLNAAQRLIHEKIEEQRAKTGKVRAIILKGRQQGCSTYVEGRFYWRVTHRMGVRAFILTHEAEATNNLFDMAVRYHENCPDPVKPSTGAANAKELLFDKLDSGYKVGTAGTKGVGRSSTIQYFHGSEVAFWPFAHEHAAGVMQAIPDAPDTEIILESTANGVGNFYHEQWTKAVGGESEFIAIFVPWFLQPEYRTPASKDIVLDEGEAELVGAYGLDLDQIAWRRKKVAELGSVEMFRQEYPCSPDEAFQTSIEHAVVPIELVRAAVHRNVAQTGYRRIWGLDVARSLTGDRTALAKRWGNHLIEPVQWWRLPDLMQIAGTVYQEYVAAEEKPDDICVDVIGFGAGVVDRLREMGLPVTGINVAESPSVDGAKYMRLRDELWFKARGWFEGRDVKMPADEALIGELTGVKYHITSSGKLQVEGKDEMKKRGLRSPDLADAFNLTFAASDFAPMTTSYQPPVYFDS
jgi:hypothetical protein